MVIVTTTVQLKPDKLPECLNLFSKTVPPIVAKEADWVGVTLTVDRERNTLTLLSSWRRAESFVKAKDSSAYKDAMGCFRPLFDGPPHERINDVLLTQGTGVDA